VPSHVGFNIEVKYPQPQEYADPLSPETRRRGYGHVALAERLSVADPNVFVDRVLRDVFDFAGDRPILFSSFDPDTCWLLSSKQPRFPVFQLTGGIRTGGGSDGYYGNCNRDLRSRTLMDAARWAAGAGGLRGVVSHCASVVRNPGVVDKVHDLGLMLFTYGEPNNDPSTRRVQIDAGVNAIIADHLKLTKEGEWA
jgi:glycerophosphoryl diester phosphodiesterase